MSKREFTFQDGKSDKFWNIEVTGESYTVTYGRSGTSGQTQSKSFDDEPAAQSVAAKLVAEKVKKGYVEATNGAATTGAATNGATSTSQAPPAQGTQAASVTVTPAATPKASAKKKPSAQQDAQDTTDGAPAGESSPPDLPPAVVPPVAMRGEAVKRELKLDPVDWFWAMWRDLPPLARPVLEPPVYDYEEALTRLSKLKGKYAWQTDWTKAKIAPALSREEAHFWFSAMTMERNVRGGHGQLQLLSHDKIKELMDEAIKKAPPTVDSAAHVLATQRETYAVEGMEIISLLLSQLFTPLQVVEIMLKTDDELHKQTAQHRYHDLPFIDGGVNGFRSDILPYLSLDERASMREMLRPRLDPTNWETNLYNPPHVAYHLAALIGMPDETQAVVESWADDYYTREGWNDHYHRPQEVVFGLGSGEEVNAQMRRLKLSLAQPKYVRAWLAHTEYAHLDWVGSTITDATSRQYGYGAIGGIREVAGALTKQLALAEAPETVPVMMQLMLESKGPRPAREWLDAHPLQSAQGLLPIASGRGKLAEAATDWLRGLKKRGYEDHIRAFAEALPPSERTRVMSTVVDYVEKTYQPFETADTPQAVQDALKSDTKVGNAAPKWVGFHDLPPVTFGDHRLNDTQVTALLGALQKSKAEAPHALVSAIKASADRASLDAFGWKLFERWLSEGAPSKDKWAMLAIGHLGGDTSALKLAPMIRAWPGEAQHQRAVTGLEVLRAIGSDTALMQINGIAQKVKFKGLQSRAVECMEGIAQDRDLSRAQLEDRVIPDCDLDEKGTRILDFGPRQFRFVLSPDMKPLVREVGSNAKPRPDLPKPNSKDDEAKANETVAAWKLMKKQIAEVAKVQAVRLENAMVTGRRWTPEEFEMLLARHPLMTNLVRLLVWEVASGNRRATFRLTEDGTYADSTDETFDLMDGDWAHVGIVHPLHLSEAEKRAWGEVFSDYELVPPFPQLGRTIYTLEGDELKEGAKEITRFANVTLPPQTMCFGLEKLGWERGAAQDAGGFYEHVKIFESADTSACVEYEPGLFMGGQEYWEPQKMTTAYFVPGLYKPKTYWNYPDKKRALPLSEIDPVAISEVLKDLTELAAKGEVKA